MKATPTYGSIGSIIATTGNGSALAALLERAADAVRRLPGSRLYLVAADGDTVWVVEVWDDEASHGASLQRPEVLELIAEARSIIGEMGTTVRFEPRGFLGEGLVP
jgi:quinol monooxygenase YgiN